MQTPNTEFIDDPNETFTQALNRAANKHDSEYHTRTRTSNTISAVFAPRPNVSNTVHNLSNNLSNINIQTASTSTNNIQIQNTNNTISENDNNLQIEQQTINETTLNNITNNTTEYDTNNYNTSNTQFHTTELIDQLILKTPADLLIRQIETTQVPEFYKLITTKNNLPPDLTLGNDIRLIHMLPIATAMPLIDFKHEQTPTPIPSVTLPDNIQKVLDNSFDTLTQQPKLPLDSTTNIFTMFFPNNKLVASNANRILNHIATLMDITYSLLIKQQILNNLTNNPAARIPSITGYSMPYYSPEYTTQYDCFGATTTSQTSYTELATQLAISTNYNIKVLANLRITAELEEIITKVNKTISLNEQEWSYLLSHPAQLLEPLNSYPLTPPPINIIELHLVAIHMKLRDYDDNHVLQRAIKITQPSADEYLAITNESESTFIIFQPFYNTNKSKTIVIERSTKNKDPHYRFEIITKPNIPPTLTLTTGKNNLTIVQTAKMYPPINLYPTTEQPTQIPTAQATDDFASMMIAAGLQIPSNNTSTPMNVRTPTNKRTYNDTIYDTPQSSITSISSNTHTETHQQHNRNTSDNQTTYRTKTQNTTFRNSNTICFRDKEGTCMKWLNGTCGFRHTLTLEEYRQKYNREPPAYNLLQNMQTDHNYHHYDKVKTQKPITQTHYTHTNYYQPLNRWQNDKPGAEESAYTYMRNPMLHDLFNHTHSDITHFSTSHNQIHKKSHTPHTTLYIDLHDMNINNKSIFNLSSTYISQTLLDALALGLNYIPVPNNDDPKSLLKNHDLYAKNIRTRKYFINDNNTTNTVLQKLRQRTEYSTAWEPPLAGQFLEQYITHSKKALESLIAHITPTTKQHYQPQLIKALTELKNNKNIIIKSADKKLGPVIMDKQEYINLATNNKNLGDTKVYYKYTTKPTWTKTHHQLIRILMHFKYITTNTNKRLQYSTMAKVLLHEFDKINPEFARAYYNPKMHKIYPPITLRPLCSTIGTPTYAASVLLDIKLQPYLHKIDTYIQSSTSIILKVHNTTFPRNCAFLVADIESLYPSIPTKEGLQKLKQFLDRHYHNSLDTQLILHLAEWVLTNNMFTFNEEHYIQISGTAMGTPFAVTYACIYLAELEYELTATLQQMQLTDPKILPPLYLVRFIDDIFGIFNDTYNADIYLAEYKKLRPNYIKLTSSTSTVKIDVLDVTIYKDKNSANTGKLQTTLYQKPHNRFLFIPPTSYHDNHDWIHEYINRIRLICSEDKEYFKHAQNLQGHLCERAHNIDDIQKYFQPKTRAELIQKATTKISNNRIQQTVKTTPLVFKITRTPRTTGIKRELKKILSLTKLSHEDPDTVKIFNKRNTPLMCEKRPRNISDMLIRATIPK